MTQVLISGMRIKSNNEVEDIKAFLGTSENGEEKLAGKLFNDLRVPTRAILLTRHSIQCSLHIGECSACGKWKGSIQERLERSNVYCHADFYREWRRRMWERSVYDATLNLIGSVRGEVSTRLEIALFSSSFW
jgi:hypothetical protein